MFELEKDQNKETSLLTNISLERAKIDNLYRTTLDKFDSLREQYRSASQEEYEAENNKKIDIVAAIQQLMLERSDLSAKKSSQEDIYHNLKQELQNLTNQRFQVSEELNNLIKDNANKIAEKAKAETIIQNAKQRLSEQYGMLFEVAKQFYNPDIDFEVARKTVADLKLDIRELGHVNLDSINQLEELETRYKEVKSQEQEIISAKTTIEDAISEMDKIIIERMTQTVTLVNAEFKHVFAKMFGGGMAEIRYTDPENILETGIDVIAQPPGKSIKNLKLFSGGEKALIAISLLFSILKAKPLPLCILDEVEAALDEANVIRFAEYLHTLKKDTQFIVITHRQGTMERVNKLYGATMQKRGVTTFFAVNLSDAKKTIENNN